MERSQLFDLMGELKLYGMKAAFDEIMVTAIKRQHEPQRIVGDLLNAASPSGKNRLRSRSFRGIAGNRERRARARRGPAREY
jgi:hypothetical protein